MLHRGVLKPTNVSLVIKSQTTLPNGYGNVTGENIVTHTRTRDPRTREPARVVTPVIITTAPSFLSVTSRSPCFRPLVAVLSRRVGHPDVAMRGCRVLM